MNRGALGLLLLSALGAACNRGTARVTSVRALAGVHERRLRAADVDDEALREAAREALRSAGFRLVDGPPGYRARLEVREAAEWGVGAERAAEVALELQLSPDGAGGASPVAEVGVGRVRLAGGERAAWREALAVAAREASAGLALAMAAEEKPVEQLIADLGADDPRRREQAIRVLGDRRSRAAVPALVDRLWDPDPLLAERAAGALDRIGDPRAVGPIIDFSLHLEGGRHTGRYARIIGDIGGSEARAYLLTVESGHTDAEVREAAREALADLDAREAEQGQVAEKARTRSSRPGSGSMAR